jgi:WD40 repeat protein
MVASGTDAGTVELWDVRSGARQRELAGHSEPVRSLAFDPSSGLLVSSSDDQTIRLWDVRTGTELSAIVDGHRGPVWSVALDPKNKVLATGGADGTVRLWNWVVDATTACELAAPAVTADQVEEYLPPTSAAPRCALR